MTGFLALIRREYLEHRTAFLYVPFALLGLFVLFVLSIFLTRRIAVFSSMVPADPERQFALAYFALAGLWWAYLAMLLFFYFADAYHADTRNNAMLFWKSLPQGDFKVLLSKLAAGMSIFPALIFLAAVLTGLVLALAATALPYLVPGASMPAAVDLLAGWAGLSAVFLVYVVIALLWYMPLLAWVGALSTLVGRWAIPLALLIPVGLSLLEGVVDFQTAPGGSYLMTFLRHRTDMRYDTAPLLASLMSSGPVDPGHAIQWLLVYVDWPGTLGGIVFAVIVIYLASLYRRRVIKG